MEKQPDHKLECPNCGTVHLDIPAEVTGETPIHCSLCGKFLGRWRELDKDFAEQGREHAVFRMAEGHMTRIDNADAGSDDDKENDRFDPANRNEA